MSNIVKLKSEIASEDVKREFVSYLPKETQIAFKKEVGYALQAFQSNSYLASCTPESAKKAILNVALSGLSLNPVLQQAHLVPRKKGKVVECCLDPDYKGLITMMEVLGIAKKPNAHVIYENDDFEYDYAFDDLIKYKPYYAKGLSASKRGKEYGVLATCLLSDGTKQCLFTPIERIWEIRNTSQSYKSNKNNSLWTGVHLGEMIKKTGIRLLWKVLPKNTAHADRVGQLMNLVDEADPKDEMIERGGKKIKTNESTAKDVENVIKRGTEKIDKKNQVEDAEFEEVIDLSFIDDLKLTEGVVRDKKEYMSIYNALKGIDIKDKDQIETAIATIGLKYENARDFYEQATIQEIKDLVTFIKEN